MIPDPAVLYSHALAHPEATDIRIEFRQGPGFSLVHDTPRLLADGSISRSVPLSPEASAKWDAITTLMSWARAIRPAREIVLDVLRLGDRFLDVVLSPDGSLSLKTPPPLPADPAA